MGRESLSDRESELPDRRLLLVIATPSKFRLISRGLTRRCAVCGQGGLTEGFLRLREKCPRCGYVFERKAGHFVGAVGMNTIFTFALIAVTLVGGMLLMWPDVEFVPLAAVTVSIAVLVPTFFHPIAKTLWVGIDLIIHPLEPGEAVIEAEECTAQQG
jgi:uncharacterized protein (DUF983 family)